MINSNAVRMTMSVSSRVKLDKCHGAPNYPRIRYTITNNVILMLYYNTNAVIIPVEGDLPIALMMVPGGQLNVFLLSISTILHLKSTVSCSLYA